MAASTVENYHYVDYLLTYRSNFGLESVLERIRPIADGRIHRAEFALLQLLHARGFKDYPKRLSPFFDYINREMEFKKEMSKSAATESVGTPNSVNRAAPAVSASNAAESIRRNDQLNPETAPVIRNLTPNVKRAPQEAPKA